VTKASKHTARKDLHDGRSLWADSSKPAVRLRRLKPKEDFDIIIVGGGISGSLCALVLAHAGYGVAVLDRREPGTGSTVASTALIQFEIDTPLTKLAKKIGRKNAARAYRRSALAVEALSDLIETHGLQSAWTDRQALYLAGNQMGWRGLKAEAAARRTIGLPSQFLSAADVQQRYGIETTGAILSGGAAELDPALASASCLRAAQKRGAVIISPCEVVNVESSERRVTLKTSEGTSLACRKAIFATGYEVIEGLPRRAFEIVSSWAIATKPVSSDALWYDRCLIWEAADPYLYIRATADNRVLIGGEDSGLTDAKRRAAAIPSKSQALIRKGRRLLSNPTLEIDYAWAGAFAESHTGLPVFEELEDLPDVFAILGCGGNGITFSMIAAEIVSKWVGGTRDADADLFSSRHGAK